MQRSPIFTSIALLTVVAVCRADVKLPAIISDHMVLQQSADVPIWGWADPGEEVTVTLGKTSKRTSADKEGKWKVSFAKLSPGQPLVMTVKGRNELTVNDVLVGEVWLGSGQSNMAMTVNRARDFEQEKAAATLPQIRMFTVERNPTPEPQRDCKGSWEICSPESVARFSATAYFFGRELHAGMHVPVGLINSSYGGTAIEAWTSLNAQTKLPEYAQISAEWVKSDAETFDAAAAETRFQAQRAKWVEAVKKARAENKPLPRAPRKQVASRVHQNHPANLFNGMIAPIIPYAIRGAIWYQGENNSGKPFNSAYGAQLRTLIQDWRARWGYDFPFAWVQLPDFRKPQVEPVEPSTWAVIREQMLKTLSVRNTGMAITLGLGEANDIHPKNKQEVGARLAKWARGKVYGRKDWISGPVPASHRIDDGKVTITFTNGEGLRSREGEAKGFAIAGADRRFVWANARIEGNKVIVSSPEVKEPAAVRYAWADNPVWSLENAGGLPASPFRTDDWPLASK